MTLAHFDYVMLFLSGKIHKKQHRLLKFKTPFFHGLTSAFRRRATYGARLGKRFFGQGLTSTVRRRAPYLSDFE